MKYISQKSEEYRISVVISICIIVQDRNRDEMLLQSVHRVCESRVWLSVVLHVGYIFKANTSDPGHPFTFFESTCICTFILHLSSSYFVLSQDVQHLLLFVRQHKPLDFGLVFLCLCIWLLMVCAFKRSSFSWREFLDGCFSACICFFFFFFF